MLRKSRSLFFVLVFFSIAPAHGEDDWPTFRHDTGRSGSTEAKLDLPLALLWQTTAAAPPRPAWPTAAYGDIYRGIKVLHPSETADHAPHVVVMGDRCWYASSSTDTVYCRRLGTGELLWAYTAGGPIRLPPTVQDGRVFVGADDGFLTCLSVDDGRPLWQQRIGPGDRWFSGNSRLISRWPIRAGPLVEAGRVHVGAGVFPNDGVWLAALDAKSGEAAWRHKINVVVSGPMLASVDRLFVQSLRSRPHAFSLQTGTLFGFVPGGGSLAAVWKSQLVSGPSEVGSVTGVDSAVLGALPDQHQFQFTTRGAELFAASQQAIVAVDAERRVRWKKPRQSSRCLIAANDLLVAGGDGEVSAYRAADGERVWQTQIAGTALGLAVAQGRLLVSSDLGNVYCFGPPSSSTTTPATHCDGPEQGATDRPVDDSQQTLAQEIARLQRAPAGYALVVDPPSTSLLQALSRQTSLQLVATFRDPRRVPEVRASLRRAGLIGTRITAIAQPENWSNLPAQGMNLIVTVVGPQEGPQQDKSLVHDLKNLLQPYNGTLVFVAPRDSPPILPPGESIPTVDDLTLHVLHARPALGLGEWSHPYADPGNSACSQDTLVKGPFETQWFGPPGPQHAVDRCNRGSPPLFVGGRLLVPGTDRVTAVDAYNGAVLWERPLPNTARLAVSKNSPNVIAGAKHVYVARQAECVALDSVTGTISHTLKLPEVVAEGKEWGYLALCDSVLLGSVSTSEEARRRLVQNSWEQGFLDQQPQVVSELLFARHPETGALLWQYTPRGGIVNSAVAAGKGHLYFIESDDPATRDKHTGRVLLAKLLDGGAHLVALRLDTGREAWRRPLKLKVRHCLFLVLTGNKLVVSGSRNEGATLLCDVVTHDAYSGKELWTLSQPTGLPVASIISHQIQRPLVVRDTVYFKTFACDLADGKVKKWGIPVQGCGALSASLHSTFYRAGAACFAELENGRNQALTGWVTRPGCWLHMLPAGGLVLAPESSAGCICAQYSLQTSLALRPRAEPSK